MKQQEKSIFAWENLLWNLWCICSVVGIWPRFIEPNLLATTKKDLPIKNLPKDLKGFKILQVSDIHVNQRSSDILLKKLLKRVDRLKPDLILFTGDFLCYSQIYNKEELSNLLNGFKAPYGCYAIFGNHDYHEYVSVNDQGNYDLIDSKISSLRTGWKRVFKPPPKLTKQVTDKAKGIVLHKDLVALLQKTPFKLLHNENVLIPIKNASLNICGLGEYTLGKCLPDQAFKTYEESSPGIVLAHNPDAIPHLEQYPGDLILCGHTHGGQVNLPWLCKKFMMLENPHFKRGLHKHRDKWVYINRGIGSAMFFRWFSMPEITLITLEQG